MATSVALVRIMLAGLFVAASSGVTSAATTGDSAAETRAYAGTREIRFVVDAGCKTDCEDYRGVFGVEASRTMKRSGNALFEIETRFFTLRLGVFRSTAAMREVVVRDEHVAATDGDVTLDQSEVDRLTFGYFTSQGLVGHTPFDGVDDGVTIETYEMPPLIFTTKHETFTNMTARSTLERFSDSRGQPESGTISESVARDRTVGGNRQDFERDDFEQNPDGSGHSTKSLPGFYNVDLQIAAPAAASDGTYAIGVSTSSTGRTIGPPPYPVSTSSYTVPDWYPGGKELPADTNVLTASGAADTPVPAACGAVSRGRLAHRVIDRRAWTRITGLTESDTDETYWTGRTLLCEIERRHTENYDVTTGKRTSTNDETTTLGIARR